MTRFILLCKRQLLQPVFVLLLLFLPASCLFIRRLEQDSASSLYIGLYAEEEDSLTSACISSLLKEKGSISFLLFTDREEMLTKVAANGLDCAYAFPADLHARLMEQDYKNSITCYTSSFTMMEALSKEVVFSALFRELGREVAAGWLEAYGLSEELPALYGTYLAGNQIFHLDYQYLDTMYEPETEADAAPVSAVMPIRGLVAVLLFISGLSGGVTCLSDREHRLPVPASACILIPLLFMSVSALFALFLGGEASMESVFKECLILLWYDFLILVFVRILLLCIKKPALLSASIPVFLLGSLVFCPVFINLGALLPFFQFMEKLFLPCYYLSCF